MREVVPSSSELIELRQAILRLIACYDARIDSTNRGADDPIRFDSRLVQCLIYANLVGAEGPTALKHEHDLSVRLFAKFIDRSLDHRLGHVTHPSLYDVHNECAALQISVCRPTAINGQRDACN